MAFQLPTQSFGDITRGPISSGKSGQIGSQNKLNQAVKTAIEWRVNNRVTFGMEQAREIPKLLISSKQLVDFFVFFPHEEIHRSHQYIYMDNRHIQRPPHVQRAGIGEATKFFFNLQQQIARRKIYFKKNRKK
jgi:hypothetical protein